MNHDPRIAFAITLARALHRYGTPTHRLEETMRRVLERLGLEGTFFSIPTGIFASFGRPEELSTTVIRTEIGGTDLGKLSDLDELGDRVIAGELGPREGAVQVDEIASAPPRYSATQAVGAFALSSAAAARFFGGGWREIVIAGVIGMLGGVLSLVVRRSSDQRRLFELLAAILAASVAALGASIVAPVSTYTATLAGLIILVPGLGVTTAMTELATGNLVSGTARLTGAALTFLEIGFGVALGGALTRILPSAQQAAPEPLADWTLWAALTVAPIGFAVLLNARWRDLGWVGMGCVVAFIGSRLGTIALGPQLGAFVGSVALGIVGNGFARLLRRPSAVVLVPGLILLVPGSIGFGSLARFIERDITSGVEAAFSVVMVATALAVGLLVANVLLPSRRSL